MRKRFLSWQQFDIFSQDLLTRLRGVQPDVSDLWLWEAGSQRRLTRGERASGPRFSPDGRLLAYGQGAVRAPAPTPPRTG